MFGNTKIKELETEIFELKTELQREIYSLKKVILYEVKKHKKLLKYLKIQPDYNQILCMDLSEEDTFIGYKPIKRCKTCKKEL